MINFIIANAMSNEGFGRANSVVFRVLVQCVYQPGIVRDFSEFEKVMEMTEFLSKLASVREI